MRHSSQFEHQGVKAFRFGYHPFAKPILYVQLYFVDGLLIDTGQAAMQKEISSATQALDIQQILITHHHEDHTGNTAFLRNQHKVKAYSSEGCATIMKNPPPISLARKLTWGDRPADRELIPIKNSLETSSYTFDLIPIPGHAPDMIALHEASQGWLFSADLYVNSYIDYMLFDESISQQMESIERALRLDFEVLFCQHKPRLSQGKKHLKAKLEFLKGFSGEVAHFHSQGLSEGEIFKAMKLKENFLAKLFSGGELSKLNMLRSAIRDLKKTPD